MENEAGMINNLSKVTEQYVAESRPVNSEGGNLELPGRIKSFVIHVPFAQKLNEKQWAPVGRFPSEKAVFQIEKVLPKRRPKDKDISKGSAEEKGLLN